MFHKFILILAPVTEFLGILQSKLSVLGVASKMEKGHCPV
jgi:hypothetical protein